MAPKILTVVGARPQFIKAAPVSLALAEIGLSEIMVHTGQHYDYLMSDVFFESLGLGEPQYNLECGSGRHGAQTGAMLTGIEDIILIERPDLALVYGDTNSTLAGALAAAKLHVPVAHVEAGLRSFNREMPEEINRVLTDHVADILFAPTDAAMKNLAAEGLERQSIQTGDVMLDTVTLFRERVGSMAGTVLGRLGVTPGEFFVATVHRAENTDDPDRWQSIARGLCRVAVEVGPVVWAVHPRVRDRVMDEWPDQLKIVDPLPYFDMQALVQAARGILTDSGGLQKEAAFHQTPCITLRNETEWVELLDAGVNVLVGTDGKKLFDAARRARWPKAGIPGRLYGDGNTAREIAAAIHAFLTGSGGDRRAATSGIEHAVGDGM